PLDSESLQTTVEKLYLDDNKNLDDITFCRNYKTLKRINLSGCPNISDYSPLDSESLQSTVEWLSLSGAQLSSLNELDSYSDRQLDFGFVGEETEINNSNQDFCNIRNLINLSFLKDYKVLRDLIIEEVEIKDIYPLLDYEFVRNGSLKRIDLGNSIDWNRKDENGKYVNGETIQELIRKGIKVILPNNFSYTPQKEDKEDEIRTLFQKAGLEDEIYIEKAKEYDVQQKLEGGFSSNIIVSSDESVIKISGNKPAQNELKIYSLDLKQMNAFIPKLKDFLKLDNTTLMVLSNVRNCESGFHKSGFHDPILHNLYLMGLFHKEATKAVGKNGILMDSLIYETLDGEKHYESMTIPLSHFNKQESREFRYESPYNLVKQVSPIIEDVNAYIIEDADTIVHGDWKLENTVNGHIFDFGVSRRGKEVEDISYFLSEMNFKFKSEQMDQYIDYYIKFRSLHDCEFANDTKKHLEIKKYFIPARLKELSIRTGVRRKRKQTEENTQIRRYYIEQMKESYNQRNLMFS
ncbi:MAG: hypothetical protein KAS15_08745, partial [Nanoarchaeota archaeon]|nr:hypothetical protein [Nanoarchaeota archaeon]